MLHDGRSLVALEHREAYRLLNSRFHEAIYDGAANPHLRETVLGVRRSVMAFRAVQFRVEERLHLSQSEHAAVVAAILDRDGAAAAAAMGAHILTVRRTVETYLRKGSGLSI
jgi:DNA-binding GntR family transcriptional regulator